MKNHTDDEKPASPASARTGNHPPSKEEKLAQALRRNLMRRKQAETGKPGTAKSG